jgi:acyl-CoA synthetase (AMP-forming)/AMP-acid ligase II
MRIIDFFDRGCRLFPDRPFLKDEHITFTHREVQDLSHKIVNGLLSGGLEPGNSVIGVLSRNNPRAFICVLGALRSFVWLPLNALNSVADNVAIMSAHDCEWLFFHSEFADEVRHLRRQLPGIRQFICVDQSIGEHPCLDQWAESYASGSPYHPQQPNDVSVIWPTGGTTGRSKGVLTTHLNWETMIANFFAAMPYSEPPIHLVVAPMTHAAGVVIFALMGIGVTNVFMPKADSLQIAANIQKHRVTTLFLPPTAIYSMLADPQIRGFDYSSLKYFIYAAAPMSEEKLKLAIEVFGPVMAQTFGQAESPMICCFLSPSDHLAVNDPNKERRLLSCGRPSLFTQVEIMDDDGNILEAEEKGEIVVRGNLVTLGYNKNPEATAKIRQFGWHHTGDVGFKDQDGYVYIVDRKHDLIISGGFNLYPNEIEQVIWSHPAVQDCAVVGVPDEKWGEAVKAIIQLKPSGNLSEEDLMAFCRGKLGGLKCPKSIEIWPELPRSPVGKVLKKNIRDKFWVGRNRNV